MLDTYNGNKQFLLQRVEVLNDILDKQQLSTIVEFGFSPTLCSLLNYDRKIIIERSHINNIESYGYEFIQGDYYNKLPSVLFDNTCYTYFLADSSGAPVSQERKNDEEIRKKNLIKVIELLQTSNLSNSFLCIWYRRINKQDYEIMKL